MAEGITLQEMDSAEVSRLAMKSEVGTLSNLQTTTKSNLVAAINEAFQSGNERKSQMVAALVARGVPATTNDSWDSLIGKMDTISQGMIVSLNHTMPSIELDTSYRPEPFNKDELIINIPAGVTNLAFVSDGISLQSIGARCSTYTNSRTSSPTFGAGSLYLGLKDNSDNLCVFSWSVDSYYGPFTDYLYAVTLDLTGTIPSFIISSEEGVFPGSNAKRVIRIPENFNYNAEMSFIFRSEIKNNLDKAFKVTRSARISGTLTYS